MNERAALNGSRSWIAWLLAIAAPAWLVTGNLSSPQSKSPVVQAGATPPPDAHVDNPTSSCTERFFAPFRGLTGQKPTATSTEHTRAKRVPGTADDEWDITSSNISEPAVDFEETIESTRAAIVERFGAEVEIEVVIATIPDPIDSGLGYLFDTELQALQYGLEQFVPSESNTPLPAYITVRNGSGVQYNRDRSWLPWDDRVENTTKRPHAIDCRSELPGVMLFRRSKGSGVLVALLVGETPTSGVNAEAMRRALELELSLGRAPCCGTQRRTRILGPNFSGSALSLRQALEHRKCPGESCPAVKIVSATANGPNVEVLLRDQPGGPTIDVDYRSTTVPETTLECTFLHFVDHLEHPWLHDASNQSASTTREPAQQSRGVAIVHELGTEFGGTSTTNSKCRLRPELYLGFPFHVSTIRDAYEDLDKHSATEASQDPAIARHTSLLLSLHEPNLPLDLQAEIAPNKTTNAQDLALAHLLTEISREGVRYVGIQATDIGDAIFIARKIRDVAPDVRLAFFNADSLLLHPEFQSDLHGSLVVSPYPFLGSSDFAADDGSEGHHHIPFESDAAEATFNAALRLRGAALDRLFEYDFTPRPADQGHGTALPVWIAAVGRSGLVPLRVQRSLDCANTIAGRSSDRAQDAICHPQRRTREAWRKFEVLRAVNLHIDHDVAPPRLWHFVTAMLVLLTLIDRSRLERMLAAVPRDPIPKTLHAAVDRELDLAFCRMKWLQLATARSWALTVASFYMASTTFAAIRAYESPEGVDLSLVVSFGCFTIGVIAAALALAHSVKLVWMFSRDLFALRALAHECKRPSDPHGWFSGSLQELKRWLVGYENLFDLPNIIYSSYARLRSSTAIGIAMTALVLRAAWQTLQDDASPFVSQPHLPPNATLQVLRNLSLNSGLSATTPLLIAVFCIYVCCVAAMKRVDTTLQLSRMTPNDRERDGAATPISTILHSIGASGSLRDHGFTHQERALTNPILRLNALSRYTVTILVSIAVPFVLFLLKPPSSLEHSASGVSLFGLLILACATLCLSTLQFYEHWRALGALLKRLAHHPLAPAFARTLAFARESVDVQISGVPNDVARLAACAEAYEQLAHFAEGCRVDQLRFRDQPIAACRLHGMTDRAVALTDACQRAYEASIKDAGSENAAKLEAEAGMKVIEAARELAGLLMEAWRANLIGLKDGAGDIKAGSGELKGIDSVQYLFSREQLNWLRRAEAYVATVVAVILNRHVRQVSHFIWGGTVGGLLLLTAIVSYPFEPHRALLTCIWVLMGTVVSLGMYVFVKLDRDTVLSDIANSLPGEVTVDRALMLRVFVWVVMPLLTLLAAQYPQIAAMLGHVVEPVARTLR